MDHIYPGNCIPLWITLMFFPCYTNEEFSRGIVNDRSYIVAEMYIYIYMKSFCMHQDLAVNAATKASACTRTWQLCRHESFCLHQNVAVMPPRKLLPAPELGTQPTTSDHINIKYIWGPHVNHMGTPR